MTCLETTFLIDLLRGKTEVKNIKDELDRTETHFTVATPSIIEIWSGALQSNQSLREQEKINKLLSSMILLSLDGKTAKEAAEIEAELIKKGLEIQLSLRGCSR